MTALLRFYRIAPIAGLIANRIRFPGLQAGLRVEIEGSGRLIHGDGVAVGEGSRIHLASDSTIEIGAHVGIGRHAHLASAPGRAFKVGSRTTIQDNCRIYGDVSIGQRCIFAPNVFVSSGTHVFDAIPHLPIQVQELKAPAMDRKVRIFGDCWFGINAVVMPGVTIGRGCVIGANAVVTRDMPPYSVVVGNPARAARERLAFVPRERIEANAELDTPYFYDGFDLAGAAGEGQATVEDQFVLALHKPGARHIRLRAAGAGCALSFAAQTRTLSDAPETVEFELDTASVQAPYFRFDVAGRCRLLWAELN